MSTLASHSRRPAEPFGQTGVREHLGAAVATLCGIAMICCVVMLARSHFVRDELHYLADGRVISAHSVYGRLIIHRQAMTRPRPANTRFVYHSESTAAPVRDGWQDSVWKLIGFEWRRGNPWGPFNEEMWWARIKWSTLAWLCAVFPITRGLLLRRRERLQLLNAKRGRDP